MFTYGMDCVKRTPDSFSHTLLPSPPPAPPKKTLGEELKDSLYKTVAVPVGESVTHAPTYPDPISGTRLHYSGTILSVGPQGANPPSPGGPGVVTPSLNFFKWLFVFAPVITAKSEPVQEAAHKVVDFTTSSAKAVADFAVSATVTVAQVVNSAVKAVEEAATSTWNWFKSWF